MYLSLYIYIYIYAYTYHIYIYIYIYTQYIKIVNCLTISQEINLAIILTISHNFK